MISRVEFYACIGIVLAVLIFSIYSNDDSSLEIEKARLNTLDSIYQSQRDSAFARALQYEVKADSQQAVINRKNLDIQNIQKKYEKEKRNVLNLNADSSLLLFERTVTH